MIDYDLDERGDCLVASIRNSPIASVISDPRLPDNPIVAVNDAFVALTLSGGIASFWQARRRNLGLPSALRRAFASIGLFLSKS
jgi:hypothetical protein